MRALPRLLWLGVCVAAAVPARAEEGMWTFDNPPRAAVKTAYGVDLTPSWLEHLRRASVRIPGCSASFASPQGLLLTNHHSDVRLVFAPEGDIAHFGGDPDNFDFPRFCLDMALLRVYGEDGQPLRPQHWLTWSRQGTAAGDPVFVTGHPGATQRLLTAAQLRARRDLDYPLRLELGSEQRGRLIEFSKRGAEEARTAKATLLSIENNIKRWRGQMRALLAEEQLAAKAAAETTLRQRVARDPALAPSLGDPWADLERASVAYRRHHLGWALLEERQGFSGNLFLHAWILARGAIERPKPNTERLREFADSALPAVEQRLLAKAPLYPQVETVRLGFSLEKLREHLGPDDPIVRRLLGQEAPQDVAARLIASTRLADATRREELWRGGAAALAAAAENDPLLRFAMRVEEEGRRIRERWDDEVEAVEKRAGEAIARARFAAFGTSIYPDATGTLRLTYGSVRGWDKRLTGAPIEPFTRLGGVFERATGRDPFALPARWLTARPALDDSATPFDLVATTDIIGGNSGSPMVDARGELVGLVFDGNLPSLAGAFWFDLEANRTVAVDVRAMREALGKIYGAQRVLDEIDGRSGAAP